MNIVVDRRRPAPDLQAADDRAEVLATELDDRGERRRARRMAEARFPRLKRLDDFDFGAAPTVDAHGSPAARGRRVRGGILIGIFLLGYPVSALIERAETRDNEKADRKAEEVPPR